MSWSLPAVLTCTSESTVGVSAYHTVFLPPRQVHLASSPGPDVAARVSTLSRNGKEAIGAAAEHVSFAGCARASEPMPIAVAISMTPSHDLKPAKC